MSKRKIAECVNIRIRTGDFEHIEIVKYAEEEIEFSNDAERIEKEDELNASLVDSVLRSLKAIPERIGKGKAAAIEVEQKIAKAIPAWLASDPVPNIANNAKKVFNTEVDKQQKKKDKLEQNTKNSMPDEASFAKTAKTAKTAKEDVITEVVASKDDVDNLFEDDPVINTPSATAIITAEKAEVASASESKDKKDDGFEDIFGDTEDLF